MPLFNVEAVLPIVSAPGSGLMQDAYEALFVLKLDERNVSVKFIANQTHVQVYLPEEQISDDALDWLRTFPDPSYSNYPVALADEFERILQKVTDCARQIVERVKFFLTRPEFGEDVVGRVSRYTWQHEKQSGSIPVPPMAWMTGHSRLPLNSMVRESLQDGIDKGYKPLVGVRHLYKAMLETEPRFKWINTTIALELAIKEALAIKEPKLALLLRKMPSPPLPVLYFDAVKEYFGAEPKFSRNKYATWAQVRNDLVHQPDKTVNASDAAIFLREAFDAINHLYSILYPDWWIAQQMKSTQFTA